MKQLPQLLGLVRPERPKPRFIMFDACSDCMHIVLRGDFRRHHPMWGGNYFQSKLNQRYDLQQIARPNQRRQG